MNGKILNSHSIICDDGSIYNFLPSSMVNLYGRNLDFLVSYDVDFKIDNDGNAIDIVIKSEHGVSFLNKFMSNDLRGIKFRFISSSWCIFGSLFVLSITIKKSEIHSMLLYPMLFLIVIGSFFWLLASIWNR